jgi:hypothetical protein
MSEETHHCDGCAAIDQLRKELDQKHSQNRSDIHKFRNEMQGVLLEVTELKARSFRSSRRWAAGHSGSAEDGTGRSAGTDHRSAHLRKELIREDAASMSG